MPVYEYTCKKCNHTFEHLARRFSDPPPDCPNCGEPNPKRLLSSFSTTNSRDAPASSCPTGTCPLS